MPSILDIVDTKNRINYRQLKNFVAGMSISEFTDQAQYPFLIGKELYDGEFMTRSAKSSATSTLHFNVKDMGRAMRQNAGRQSADAKMSDTHTQINLPPGIPVAAQESSGMSQAIYLINKKPYSLDPEGVISIGRSANNDIVIADFVISKIHAHIILFNGRYFIVDMGSTNGTNVDHQMISPGSKIQLQFNSTVSFGRLVFVFTNPLIVYNGLRKEILGI